MSKHQEVWQQAVDDLNQSLTLLVNKNKDLAAKRQELAERVQKLRDDIKYAAQEDKPSLIQELNSMQQRERNLEIQEDIVKVNTDSPYFAKVVSDEGYYISKHFSDSDNNIIKFTAPLAVLRYKEVGEKVTIRGFHHCLREKQQLEILGRELQKLYHFDARGNFVCDAHQFREYTAGDEAKEIEVCKENMANALQPVPQPQEEKKYVLGEIITKMKEEQDRVMRAPIRGVTLIKGSAGSGKTNIAFHRIVYLCSEFPDQFRQENIAVFCFNVALKQYLSNMLAELNIPSVQVFSIDEWYYSILKQYTNIGWPNYKEDNAVKYLKTRWDIIEILNAFFNDYLHQLRQAVEEIEHDGKKEMRIDAYKILNLLYTYRPFLQQIKVSENYARGKYKDGAAVEASDLYLLALLVHFITKQAGDTCFGAFDHIVVDEVQDLSPVQMALIHQLHNDSLTLVGDVTQKIFSFGIDSWDQLNIPIDHDYTLNMCHRSTLQTVLFANQLVAAEGDELTSTKVGRQGEKPMLFMGKTRTDSLKKAVALVKEIKEREPQASVTVASYRNYDLKWIEGELAKAGIDCYIATRRNWEFSPRTAVTTYHQIKGLEFDYVIILGLNDYYRTEDEQKDRIVYTVVTRAQKRVYIGCVKTLPPLLEKVDKDLYLLD